MKDFASFSYALCIMHYVRHNMPPVLRAIDKENPDVYREISRRIPDDRDKSDSPMTSHFGVTPGSAGRWMENALSPTRYIPPTTFVAPLQQLQTTEHTRIVLLAKQPAPYAFPPALALTCVNACVRNVQRRPGVARRASSRQRRLTASTK